MRACRSVAMLIHGAKQSYSQSIREICTFFSKNSTKLYRLA